MVVAVCAREAALVESFQLNCANFASVPRKLAINIDINIPTSKHKRIFKRTNLQPEYLPQW